MFEGDWSDLGAAATLEAAVEFDVAENHAALGKLRAALHFADLHGELPPTTPRAPGAERLKVYGGDGCPAIAEFAPAEYGTVLGLSTRAATSFIGEALALRHRLPRVWALVLAEEVPAWRARAVARASHALTLEAAARLDRRIAGKLATLSTHQMYVLLEALIKEADPEAAQRAAEERAKERGVWVNPSDGNGTKTIYVKAATGDVIRFNATIHDLAWALAMMGDTDTLDQRRAKAIGWIADPTAAHELIAAARYLATHPNTTGNGESDRPPATPGSETAGDGPGVDTEDHLDVDAGNGKDGAAGNDIAVSAGTHGENYQGGTGAPADEYVWDWFPSDEPTIDAEADRDPVNPSDGDHLDHLDGLTTSETLRAIAKDAWKHPRPHDEPPHHEPAANPDPAADAPGPPKSSTQGLTSDPGTDANSRDEAARRLAGKLASIGTTGTTGVQRRPRNVLYAHLTDETLLTGNGLVRVEEHGALLVSQLRELLGHDQVVLTPVIDLNQPAGVNAYEIPDRIRERVRLINPVEQFPFGTTETTPRTDLDHVVPYDPTGPPGQTSTTNLTPLGRFHHRLKTHGRWTVEPLDGRALRWRSPNGFEFHLDHTGTRRITERL